MSRPEKPIDWDLVDELLVAGCLGTEIAPHFNLHPTTFYNRVEEKHGMSFTNYSCEKCSQGDSILRKVQFDKAVNADSTMLIWLGKNRLKQSDKDLSKEINEVKADLGKLSASIAEGRAQHVAAQPTDRSESRDPEGRE